MSSSKPLVLCILAVLPVVLCAPAYGQHSLKVARIGYLGHVSASVGAATIRAFRQGLRELGYVEGKNVVIEWRHHGGKLDSLPALAAELVSLNVDVIITSGAPSTRAAREATTTIPIVMAQDRDPVGSGFVASLARPGGNITGLSRLAPELSGKQLELLKAIVPKLSRLAIFRTSTTLGTAQALKEIELVAPDLGVTLQYLDVLNPTDIETAFRAAVKGRSDAVLMMMEGAVVSGRRTEIAELAVKSRLPVIHPNREFVEVGGLISYGVNFDELYRRAATYVDKILKGSKPTELPVEQPTKFELVINLRAAKQIGLTIPPHVLARADRVIR